MDSNNYDRNFSKYFYQVTHDFNTRNKKANTIINVFQDYFRNDLKNYNLLDIGCSTGIITNYLAHHFSHVYGVDIDNGAISYAIQNFSRNNLHFEVQNSTDLTFSKGTFDTVLCNHVYEHVPDVYKLMDNIYDVLKPGGICYLSAGNRLNIVEPHHNLLFLSIIPQPLAHSYMRLMKKGNFYYERHRSYWGLKKMVKQFVLIDYTRKLINHPETFGLEYILKPNSFKHYLSKFIITYMYWLSPGYVWILKKYK